MPPRSGVAVLYAIALQFPVSLIISCRAASHISTSSAPASSGRKEKLSTCHVPTLCRDIISIYTIVPCRAISHISTTSANIPRPHSWKQRPRKVRHPVISQWQSEAYKLISTNPRAHDFTLPPPRAQRRSQLYIALALTQRGQQDSTLHRQQDCMTSARASEASIVLVVSLCSTCYEHSIQLHSIAPAHFQVRVQVPYNLNAATLSPSTRMHYRKSEFNFDFDFDLDFDNDG